jgi:N-acetyl-gamma-glutamyl-phosphate reductase
MAIRVGIAGVSGYGGGELLRLCAGHPAFEVVYAAGETSAGQKLLERFPGIPPKLADLTIEKWDPAALPKLDLLFASLPTGQSKAALASVPKGVKIVDVGGDHRYVDGWVYGLTDVWPEKIRSAMRVANPGCYPSAALLAIAPLIAEKLVGGPIIIDAKSGISGAGRGGVDSKFGFAEVNEDISAYGLLKHPHLGHMLSAGQYHYRALLRSVAKILCRPTLRAHRRSTAPHEMGDGIQSCFHFLCGNRKRIGDRPRRDRQPRQGRRRAGGPKREPDVRAG